jgi:hypothetical protein
MEVEPHPKRNRRSVGVCWRDPGRAAGPRTSWLDHDSKLIVPWSLVRIQAGPLIILTKAACASRMRSERAYDFLPIALA